jgi:hypothetical protein
MSGLELVDLGASGIDESSGAIWAQSKGAEIEDGDAPDYGKAPLMAALGVAARPAPANSKGSAQGIATGSVGGLDGAIIGAHDPRAAKVYGEISEGETALFATGDGFDARVLCKDQSVSIIVGDDFVLTVNRESKQIAINCPGGMFQISNDSGVTVCDASGKASLRLYGGAAYLCGSVVLGGGKPLAPVADSAKVTIELAKIAVSIGALVGAATTGLPTPGVPPYVPGIVAAPGVFVGK